MALSGFIKQLLQTDTVFGSEAKKVTGINDSIIQLYYSDVNASFLIDDDENTFTLVLNNYDTSISTPTWFIPGKYIKLFFFNFDSSQTVFQDLTSYSGRLFQIELVILDESASTLTITFVPGAEGTPPFNTDILPNIPSVSNFDLKFDGRIFSLIGDPDIAREASNGSTMFNLDNENVSPFSDADSSGIARKYASHYHTDVTTELVVHDKDDAGFDLVRIGINIPALTRTILYDEKEAKIQAQMNPPIVSPSSTFIEFTAGAVTETVAEYGEEAIPLKGIFFRMKYSTNHADVPRGVATDTDLTAHDGFHFNGIDFYVNIPQSLHNPVRRNWLVFNNFQFTAKLEQEKAADEVIADLNNIFPLYTFSRITPIDPAAIEIEILYEAKTPGSDNSQPTLMNRTTPNANNPVLSIDPNDVRPGMDEPPLTGVQFRTFGELVSRLREARNNFPTLSFTVDDTGGVIILGTDTDTLKSFTVTVPDLDPPVFSNLVASDGLTGLTVDNGTFRTLKSHPDIVFDLDGNAVFAAPIFGVGR